jgi:hypothetical protein
MSTDKRSDVTTHPNVHESKTPGKPGAQISPSAVPATNDKPQPNVDADKNRRG